MSREREAVEAACDRFWGAIRRGDGESVRIFHRRFRLEGFPGPSAGMTQFRWEAPEEADSGTAAAGGQGPPDAAAPGAPGGRPARGRAGSGPADSGRAAEPGSGPLDPEADAGVQYLQVFFGEGRGLTNLIYERGGIQVLDGFAVAVFRWIAEPGIGQSGSPRYVSGRATVSFRNDAGGNWLATGWLGIRGSHDPDPGVTRGDDVRAIREQILRVFEAYRQKDLGMLRRTHTADWRGFTLQSGSVGRGIDAYMRAAQGAIASMQFEEYKILDLDAVFYGDFAVVPYVARIAGRNRQGVEEAYRLRVLDVYLREPLGWNQIATNVSLHPEEMLGG